MTWFRWLRRRPMIPVIQLSGALDFTNYMFFLRCMRVCRNKSNLAGLCLQISSQGGSGVRADVMAKMCRDFCDQRGIKLYTFVDKYACSAAMLPLASSDRVYVHPESIVGGCLATASRFVSTDGYGVELWNAKSSDELLMKNHSVLLDNEAREEKFEDLMNNVLKEDTRKLIEEINEKLGSRLNPAYTQRIDAGAYLNGKEAVEAGIAHGYGTIQKTLLKDHPDAKLLFIPRIDKGMLTRRYFNRSIRSGRMV